MARAQGHVLVTGGAGYLGAHVVLALQARGYLVTAVDDLSSGSVEHTRLADRFVRLDVRDRSALYALLTSRPTGAVVHLAGRFSAQQSIDKPEVTSEVIVGGTASLLSALRAARVRRLVVGSDLVVYGHPQKTPVSEETPVRPTLPLGRSLAHIEQLQRDCGNAWNLKTIALRLGQLAGADPELRAGDTSSNRDRFVTRLAKVAHKARPGARFKITSIFDANGAHRPQIIDLLHVSDGADAVVAALRGLEDDDPPPVANVGSGAGIGLDKILDAVVGLSGHPIEAMAVPMHPDVPVALVGDTTRFRHWTNWTPRRSDLESILTSALAFEARGTQ